MAFVFPLPGESIQAGLPSWGGNGGAGTRETFRSSCITGPSETLPPLAWGPVTSSCPPIRDCTRRAHPSVLRSREPRPWEPRSGARPASSWLAVTAAARDFQTKKPGLASPGAPINLSPQKGSKRLSQESACELEPPPPAEASRDVGWAGRHEGTYFGSTALSNVQKSEIVSWGVRDMKLTRRRRPLSKASSQTGSASGIPSCAFSRCVCVRGGIPEATRSSCTLDPPQAPGFAKAGPKVTVLRPARGVGEGIPVGPRCRRAGQLLGRGRPNLRGPGSAAPCPTELRRPRTRTGHRRIGGCGRMARPGPRVTASKVQAGPEPGEGPRPHSPSASALTGRGAPLAPTNLAAERAGRFSGERHLGLKV